MAKHDSIEKHFSNMEIWVRWDVTAISGILATMSRDELFTLLSSTSWETVKETTKSSPRRNESKQLFPQYLVKLKSSLHGMLQNVCGFKKWSAKFLREKSHSLKYKTQPLSDVSLGLKIWRWKEWYWKNVTRCLPCSCSFSLECPVEHPEQQSFHVREVSGTTEHNQPDTLGTSTATARVFPACSKHEVLGIHLTHPDGGLS